MALSARQITLVTSTATPLLVQGTTTTKFKNITGSVSDPLPVHIHNDDASIIVWIGGSDVDATHGIPLSPGQDLIMNLYGEGEIPYAFAVGTPILSVLCGRQ